MTGVVTALAVYPVKGLSQQPLDEVELEAGRGFPRDRTWALARAGGAYRPGVAAAVDKHEFHMLARDERLAGLRTRVDGARLQVSVREHVVLDAVLEEPAGQVAAQAFFARVLGLPAGAEPIVACEPDRRFTDVSVVSEAMMHAVSFLNLASVRALEERVGVPIDPLRFRANVLYDGLPAFGELSLVGSPIVAGDVRLEAVLTTRRCAATEVDPATGRRDLPVPQLLHEHLGHTDMGVYGIVRAGGRIRVGDPVAYDAGG